MLYELFVGWRYLYAPRPTRLLLGLAVGLAVVAAAGALLFFTTPWRAAGAILLLSGVIGTAFAVMSMFSSAFTAISALGVALGVAILIWVLSVTSGFQEEFRRKVLGVNAHALVLKYGTDFAEYREVMRKAAAVPGVVAAAPFVFNEMMLARGSGLSGVLVKGIDPERAGSVLDLPQYLVQPITARRDRHALATLLRGRGIVIGRELARKLDAHVGDRVRLVSPLTSSDGAGWSPGHELPRARDFRVAGIFYSGFDEYDRRLVYVHLAQAQAFFDQGDVVTGVELKVADVFAARAVARRVSRALGADGPYRTVPWSELNSTLFTALQNQKLMLEVVIGFIVIVAAFNMLAALAVLVIRKTREIAILKALGMTSSGVARVFQGAGMIVWAVGTALGLSWGYLGGLLLRRYGFQLDARVYLLSELPVRMLPLEFVLTAVFALAVCLLATVYPAVRAARMDPVQGLRV
ncbi:MAG: ABC transporter permease [Proteobacteria bacterium]|nr:ABC transporter permease [Pseudomonadota bacterium]